MNSVNEEDTEFIFTIQRMKISRQLCDFIEMYPDIGRSKKLVHFDDKFQNSLKLICENLSKMEFSHSSPPRSSMHTVLVYANQILTHFTNVDIRKPLCFVDYQLYLKLATVIERLKNVLIDNDSKPLTSGMDKYFNAKVEQHLVDTYKSKLQHFKASGCEEVKLMNVLFTNFLLEYIKLILKSDGKLSLQKSIELLCEIGDLEILMVKFHKISTLFPVAMKISILKKITKLCLKNNYTMQDNPLLISNDFNFKVELLILSYYVLQHLCEFLEFQQLNQSFQLLSKISVDNMISENVPIMMYNLGSEKINVKQELILKTYTDIKTVPSNEIKNCLMLLKALFFSLRRFKLHWCDSQLKTVLLSLLFEFAMGTNLDKSCIETLIDINIGVIEGLPIHFKAGSYALKIYQKLKYDDDLVHKVKILFGKMPIYNAQHYNTKLFVISDLKKLFRCGENWIDVSIIASCFLSNSVMDKDEMVDSLFYALNECVILASQNTPINGVLVVPFSLSLCHSLETKNDDCLFNNLAVLHNYLNFVMNKYQWIPMDDRKTFINVIIKYYKDIIHYLPDESIFLVNCWELVISPSVMDLPIMKELLNVQSSEIFSKFIDILKIETLKLIEGKESALGKEYFQFITLTWYYLLHVNQLTSKNIKVRKDLVNHFCYMINRIFLFQKDKVPTEMGLLLLMKIVSCMLRMSWVNWINTSILMNCSLRIITYVERNDTSDIEVLAEAAELLIVLYKCPKNSIKPHLGLFLISFTNVLKKCCKFAKDNGHDTNITFDSPFHKLVKCSSSFRYNKDDFVFISRCTLENLLEIITIRNNLPEHLMNYCHSIINNLMEVCSDDELKNLAMTAHGPAGDTISQAYREYTLHFRFNGRL